MPPDTCIPPDDPAPFATLIDHSRDIALLEECTDRAMSLIRLAHARAEAPEAALAHPSSRRAANPMLAFDRLVRTLNRIIALKARLKQDQATQIDSIAAERARRAVRTAQHRRAGARMEVQRQVRIALEAAKATGSCPSLARMAGCTEENALNDLLAIHTVPEIVAMICKNLDMELPTLAPRPRAPQPEPQPEPEPASSPRSSSPRVAEPPPSTPPVAAPPVSGQPAIDPTTHSSQSRAQPP